MLTKCISARQVKTNAFKGIIVDRIETPIAQKTALYDNLMLVPITILSALDWINWALLPGLVGSTSRSFVFSPNFQQLPNSTS